MALALSDEFYLYILINEPIVFEASTRAANNTVTFEYASNLMSILRSDILIVLPDSNSGSFHLLVKYLCVFIAESTYYE